MKIDKIIDFLEQTSVNYKFFALNDTMKEIKKVSPLNSLSDYCLTWVRDQEYLEKVSFESYKGVWLVSKPFDNFSEINLGGVIFVDDPFSVYFSIVEYCFMNNEKKDSIGKTSVIKTKNIGRGVSIGEQCIIDEQVVLGDNVEIRNNVTISGPVSIGDNTVIFSGVIIGEEGFGYYTDLFGKRKRVPHVGGVRIGKNCHIGENAVISRGCLGDTIIGNNVKVDSLSHIAHNVIIGDNAYVVCLVSLAGSCEVGENAWIAPGANVKNQTRIGKNAILGLGTIAIKDIPDNVVAVGCPAKIIRERFEDEEV